jgi:hypothetical protein
MIDELCHDYGYERKYVIKLLGGKLPQPTGRKKPGPSPQYPSIEPVVRTIWLAAEQPCGKRLKPALSLWLPHYQRHHGRLSSTARELLREIRSATLDRLLGPARSAHPLRGLSGTKPGSLLRTEIPIRPITGTSIGPVLKPTPSRIAATVWQGTSSECRFLDIFSTWTAGRAVWNKGALGVVEATQDGELDLPFELLAFDSDNGSEFLNHALKDYLFKRERPVGFTRGRPYHKDDNAYVEQKNWMWPRQLLGYGRLECPQRVETPGHGSRCPSSQ